MRDIIRLAPEGAYPAVLNGMRIAIGRSEWRRHWRYVHGYATTTGAAYLRCMFHDEKAPSLKVWPDGGAHCFGCGGTWQAWEVAKWPDEYRVTFAGSPPVMQLSLWYMPLFRWAMRNDPLPF